MGGVVDASIVRQEEYSVCHIQIKGEIGRTCAQKDCCLHCDCGCESRDKADFKALTRKAKQSFNGRYNSLKRNWGKRVLGMKTRHKIDKRRRVRIAEKQRRVAAQSKANKGK